MTIDNIKTVTRDRLINLLMSMAFILVIVLILSVDWPFAHQKKGITKYHVAIFLGFIYIMILLYFLIVDRQYFYYCDQSDKLEFKYYSLRPFSFRNNYIAISKSTFLKYELKKSFFGLKTIIILYQKAKRGVAKYHPICISSLSRNEINGLKISLDQYISVT